MKKIQIIIFIVFIIQSSLGQNPYYDALSLKECVVNGKFVLSSDTTDISSNLKMAKYLTIINKYYNNEFNTPKDLHDNLADYDRDSPNKNYNPFFAKYLSPGSVQSFLSQSSMNTALKKLSGGISSPGSANVTNFADGLAKFLIKRSKQELLVSFFEKMPEFEKKYPEFRILFPNTTILINSFKSWEYANIINTLREAFDKDLKELLTNLSQITSIDTSSKEACNCSEVACNRIAKYQTFLNSEKGIAISSSLLIGSQFLSGNKLPDIINNVASKEKLEKINLSDDEKEKNIKGTLAFIRIISNALRSNDVTKSYVEVDSIKNLLRDEVTRNIFFGLIYQQLSNENITINGINLTDIITPEHVNGISNYIINFIEESTPVIDAIKKLKDDKKKPDTNLEDDWGMIFQAVNDFIPTIANVEVIDPSFSLPVGIKNVVEKSQFATAVAHDIAVKNYSAAIVGILKELSDSNKNGEFDEFKTFFVKYGSFAANVVQAQNSEEVEQAIESVALPVGSASIKKKTCFSIALNAYLGGFWGNEYLADKATDKWAPISGVYAPVGVAFSWGLNNKGAYRLNKKNEETFGCKLKNFFFKGYSISVLLNVIDIGAVASFRLQDSTTEKLPEVTLQNILAPGLGLVYGLPNFPLSIGYTYQFGPALRTITSEAATVSPQLNRRWQFFLAVDIPIFNFYTKSK